LQRNATELHYEGKGRKAPLGPRPFTGKKAVLFHPWNHGMNASCKTCGVAFGDGE